MAITFECTCGRTLRAPDDAVGKRGKCKKCGASIEVPSPQPQFLEEEPAIGLIDDPHDAQQHDAAAADGYPHEAEPASDYEVAATPQVVRRSISQFAVPPTISPLARAEARGMAALGIEPKPPLVALPRATGARRHLYWVLLLVLLPLAWSTVQPSRAEDSIVQRIKHSLQVHPEIRERLTALSDDPTKAELCAALPEDRLEGALLPEQTWAHWGFAALSGGAFLAAMLLLFPPSHTKVTHLVGIGLITGTIGIVLLLAVQWLAFHMPLFTGRSIITVLLDLLWLIGQSYRMALGDHGFVLSFLGFTAGVGFCEEACKALPLIIRSRTHGFESWRTAMLWGLVSGVGFGVSEGITYSSDYYNGIEGGGIYLVRFVSCVGLHAIWAAAVGISLYRRQDYFRGQLHVLEWLGRTLMIVIVPMILHGLYDTLLKQQYDAWALGVSLVSFGWLAYQIEMATRSFDAPPLQAGAALA